jgi:hypothetical protein
VTWKKHSAFSPGFFKGEPQDVLVQIWPVMKRYMLGELKIPSKYREMIGLAVAATLKCPYCEIISLLFNIKHRFMNLEQAYYNENIFADSLMYEKRSKQALLCLSLCREPMYV